MLISFFAHRKSYLTFEELRTIQVLAQQTVISLDIALGFPDYDQRELSLDHLREILDELGIKAPDCVLETAVDASLRLLEMNEADRSHQSLGLGG